MLLSPLHTHPSFITASRLGEAARIERQASEAFWQGDVYNAVGMMAADWQSKVGILNRIGPSVPDTAPTRDRLAGEAEQLRRQAQSAQ